MGLTSVKGRKEDIDIGKEFGVVLSFWTWVHEVCTLYSCVHEQWDVSVVKIEVSLHHLHTYISTLFYAQIALALNLQLSKFLIEDYASAIRWHCTVWLKPERRCNFSVFRQHWVNFTDSQPQSETITSICIEGAFNCLLTAQILWPATGRRIMDGKEWCALCESFRHYVS